MLLLCSLLDHKQQPQWSQCVFSPLFPLDLFQVHLTVSFSLTNVSHMLIKNCSCTVASHTSHTWFCCFWSWFQPWIQRNRISGQEMESHVTMVKLHLEQKWLGVTCICLIIIVVNKLGSKLIAIYFLQGIFCRRLEICMANGWWAKYAKILQMKFILHSFYFLSFNSHIFSDLQNPLNKFVSVRDSFCWWNI